MDPNESLAAIRRLLAAMNKAKSTTQYGEYALALHERVSDLDEWLSKGGLLPDAWKH